MPWDVAAKVAVLDLWQEYVQQLRAARRPHIQRDGRETLATGLYLQWSRDSHKAVQLSTALQVCICNILQIKK